jgi:antitoxin PrlF
MSEAAVTSKGQITIPSEIRKAMGLSEKDRVVFTVMPDGTTVMRAKSRSIVELKGAISGHKKRVSVSAMRLG